MKNDQVALVTGGTQGIGHAIVRGLLDAGVSVAYCARNLDKEFVEANKPAAGFQADVSDSNEVVRLVQSVMEKFGRIDILVNNAGIYGPIGPVWENDPEVWQQTININLFGSFLMCHAVIPEMLRAKRGGRIINISGGGAATPFPRYTAYAVSKAALVRFTETLAIEIAPHNIQVNAVAPGFVATRLHEQTRQAGELAGDFLKRTEEMMSSAVDPAICAKLITYLASDRGAKITGKFIHAVWDNWADFEKHLEQIQRSDVYTLRRIVPADRGMDWK
jgi:NAD(P)-dependent dehydrogenase (short-subunit alcohol dehydrogenase family)